MPGTVTVQILAEELRSHVEKCEGANLEAARNSKAMAEALAALAKEFADFKALPGKGLRWLLVAVAGSVISILVQNLWLHQDTSHKADVAAAAATQATAAVNAIPEKTAERLSGRVVEPQQGTSP